MIGGMLERLGGNHGGNRGEAGREAAVNNRGVPPAPPPLTPPPPPPPPSPSPVGPSITHYDETTGVPLAREAVASQQALGHTVVPLGDAYSRRLSLLQVRPLPQFTRSALSHTIRCFWQLAPFPNACFPARTSIQVTPMFLLSIVRKHLRGR